MFSRFCCRGNGLLATQRSTILSRVTSFFSTDATSTGRLLQLNDLKNIAEATKKRKRWGRGIGSNRGKTCGWGHQKSRSTPRAFEGGQTPLYKRLPKIGFHNFGAREMQILNIDKIQQFIDMGRLQPSSTSLITMRDLIATGLVSQLRDGVKLLAKGKSDFKTPIHLEVSAASTEAISAIEKAGGTVTCVHFNKLALRSLVKPYKFDILPHRARPPPRLMVAMVRSTLFIHPYRMLNLVHSHPYLTVGAYLDRTKSGYLSPEIQIRNMKIFGYVTSEATLRDEHDRFMTTKRQMLWPQLQNLTLGNATTTDGEQSRNQS